MAITVVDLSQTSKRIATPTLDHDLILSNTAAAIGARAGVVSLEVIKKLHRRRRRDRQCVGTEQPVSGKPVGGTRAAIQMPA